MHAYKTLVGAFDTSTCINAWALFSQAKKGEAGAWRLRHVFMRDVPLAATMLEMRTSFSLDDSFRVSPRREAVLTIGGALCVGCGEA